MQLQLSNEPALSTVPINVQCFAHTGLGGDLTHSQYNITL